MYKLPVHTQVVIVERDEQVFSVEVSFDRGQVDQILNVTFASDVVCIIPLAVSDLVPAFIDEIYEAAQKQYDEEQDALDYGARYGF